MSITTGKRITLHFRIMRYVLEGPPRTSTDLAIEFDIRCDKARWYLKQLQDLGYIRGIGQVTRTVRGRQPNAYVPMCKIETYTALAHPEVPKRVAQAVHTIRHAAGAVSEYAD